MAKELLSLARHCIVKRIQFMDHRVRNDGSQDRVGQEEENPIGCLSFDVSHFLLFLS